MRAAIVWPPKTLAIALTMVAPICTVARKRSGLSRSRCTDTAFLLPPETSASRRELRRDTTAISAPAKTPLTRIRARMKSTFEEYGGLLAAPASQHIMRRAAPRAPPPPPRTPPPRAGPRRSARAGAGAARRPRARAPRPTGRSQSAGFARASAAACARRAESLPPSSPAARAAPRPPRRRRSSVARYWPAGLAPAREAHLGRRPAPRVQRALDLLQPESRPSSSASSTAGGRAPRAGPSSSRRASSRARPARVCASARRRRRSWASAMPALRPLAGGPLRVDAGAQRGEAGRDPPLDPALCPERILRHAGAEPRELGLGGGELLELLRRCFPGVWGQSPALRRASPHR